MPLAVETRSSHAASTLGIDTAAADTRPGGGAGSTTTVGPGGATAIWLGFDQPTAIAPEKRLKALLDEFVKRLGNG